MLVIHWMFIPLALMWFYAIIATEEDGWSHDLIAFVVIIGWMLIAGEVYSRKIRKLKREMDEDSLP